MESAVYLFSATRERKIIFLLIMHISVQLETCVISGYFAETRKAPLVFRISVRLSARINSTPTGPIFMKFVYSSLPLESVEKV